MSNNIIESDGGNARIKDQHDDIRIGSPLAILGMFVLVVRARFQAPNDDTGYIWRADPTPLQSEESTLDAPRTLYIESGDVADPDARDVKPAIFITKGDTQLRQVVIGNRSAIHTPTRTERFYMQAVIPITIQCISDNRGESMILGDLTWFHIASAKNYIRAEFGLNDIADPILGATQLFRYSGGSAEAYLTPVSFAVTIEFHWITRPIAPMLKEISARLATIGGGDATTGAIDLALRTNRTR